jgi:hypothetical protein
MYCLVSDWYEILSTRSREVHPGSFDTVETNGLPIKIRHLCIVHEVLIMTKKALSQNKKVSLLYYLYQLPTNAKAIAES